VADPPAEPQAKLIAAAAPLIQTRISRLTQAAEMLAFLFTGEDAFTVDAEDAAKALTPDAVKPLQAAEAALTALPAWDRDTIEQALRGALIDGLGLKPRTAFAPVYVAVTGRRVAPPVFDSIALLGRDATMTRLSRALAMISA
jgi:glutamyl-tRNA synthetase